MRCAKPAQIVADYQKREQAGAMVEADWKNSAVTSRSANAANPHGALVREDGSVRFQLWAPACDLVKLELSGCRDLLSLTPSGDGWHQVVTKLARAGDRYSFVLPGGQRVPDPASFYQPEDVHGPSEIVDTSTWPCNRRWTGRPWEEAVVYELHVGAFTPEGTFRAAIGKLDHLQRLGITALEVMPVGDFAGRRGWGYDGVLPYAPDSSYGRPEDLKALVEAAHARSLMVLLDVVYNHFGPDGNYLTVYAPQFFSEAHKTGWGPGINFDGPGSRAVRDFAIHNALHWIEHFHMDGLRLDAVHAIADDSPKHILREISERVRAAAGNRHVHLLLENEENESHWLERDYTAQWNDDTHHVLHVFATGESHGYYGDYSGHTEKLGRALAQGFAFQGEMMQYRGSHRGTSSSHLPPTSFVAFLQNHDQIGNRAFGDRIAATPPAAVKAAAAIYLLLPQIPMLFMGEEWCASQPFPFFCDFDPDLGVKVREGRRQEFAKFPEFQDPEVREKIPDPQADETFASAKLHWDDLSKPPHREWLDWYKRLLQTRRAAILPLLKRIQAAGTFEVVGEGAVLVRWNAAESGELVLAANLSNVPVTGFPAMEATPLWQEGHTEDNGQTLQPWTVAWFVRSNG